MKTYKDLQLKQLAKKHNLDFAYHTFLRGQCSCCYGPKDIPQGWVTEVKENPRMILFKNAHNGSGTVKLKDELKEFNFINYDGITLEELEAIAKDMLEILGEDYVVLVPKSYSYTLSIQTAGSLKGNKFEGDKNYKVLYAEPKPKQEKIGLKKYTLLNSNDIYIKGFGYRGDWIAKNDFLHVDNENELWEKPFDTREWKHFGKVIKTSDNILDLVEVGDLIEREYHRETTTGEKWVERNISNITSITENYFHLSFLSIEKTHKFIVAIYKHQSNGDYKKYEVKKDE